MNPTENAKRLLELMEESGRGSGRTPAHSELALALGDMVHAFEELDKKINTPEIYDIIEAIKLEAAHQRQRWTWNDANKIDADWLALIVYLGSKAHYNPSDTAGNRPIEKKLHRIITVAAAAMNWHAAVKDHHERTRSVPETGTVPALQEQGDRDGRGTGHDEGRSEGG